ncbi:MAG: aspartate aminotransferase family protein [Actinomycetota bacterium]|nr:aspartate aminotransferase family protein [Actinomycetota bacterium]
MAFSNIMDSNSYRSGSGASAQTEPMIAARERLLGPASRLFYEQPVHLVRGAGAHLYDPEGNRYLDAYNNVVSVGHCEPRVVEAVTRQMSTLNTHTRYLHRGILDYSERLLATMPAGLDQVMFACTGSEANDLALRVAGMYTGAAGVIVTSDAYHGNTATVTAISPSLGGATTLGPNVRTVPAPDSYRVPAGELAGRLAADVARAADDLEAAGYGLSALVLDTIFSSDGVYATPDVLGPAVAEARRRGGVFLADEVQPGFARTGDAMWGFQRHGVVPDLVTMGKPMGNGLPVAAMAGRAEVIAPFATGVPYFNTFAGNPVSMAAAAAVLDILDADGLREHARDVGAALRAELAGIRDPRIGDVRGAGLYLGVEIVSDPHAKTPDRDMARHLVNAMRRHRVLISVCGSAGHVLKIRPPLVFSHADVDWFCSAFTEVLAD